MQERKSYLFNMSKDTKKALDDLSTSTGLTIRELIELALNRQFKLNPLKEI